jgi:predicted O-methyltransferase YrrM
MKHLHADVTHLARWQRLPVARPTRRFVRAQGLRVASGPFAGMTYPRSAVGRAEQLVAKLLGSYELELHEPLAALLERDWEQVVDIGASDGYYAVGLALRCPRAEVRAWEMNPLPARVCRELARANGVERRLDLQGECTIRELQALSERPSLVICDCEGCEDELLRPDAVPVLRQSAVVVEIHESLAPGVEARLRERFDPTHSVELLDMTPRHVGDHPALASIDGLHFIDRELLVSEFRSQPIRWAVITPTGA